ncbi:phosphopantetheine-binding protein [Streptomyces sp. M19]
MNLAREFRIPLSYGRLVLLAPLPRRIYSHHRFREADRPGKETFTDDFTLLDETGAEVARVEGFVLKRVADLEGGCPRCATARRRRWPRTGSPRGTGAGRPHAAGWAPAGGPRRDGPRPLRGHLAAGILPGGCRGAAAGARRPDRAPWRSSPGPGRGDRRHRGRGGTSGPGRRPTGGPAAAHPRPAVSTAYTGPRDATEERLAALWAGLLGLADVGVHDDFFELGGHSLLGLQLAARVRREFGVDLPLDALFEALTVAQLAPVLRAAEARRTGGTDGTP